MKLTILGSGSSGNGYILHNDNEALCIECGMPVTHMKKAIDFNVKLLKGCLVSHGHGDHSRHVLKYLPFAPIYMSAGTADEIKVADRRNIVKMKPLELVKIGGFSVIPFDVYHDSKEPFGFFIMHEEIGKLLFVTDTAFLKYKVPGLTNIMIEANFEDGILNDNVSSGSVHPALAKRVRKSHLSLRTCIDTLKANDLTAVNNIVLLHLSEDNSDSEMFSNEVEASTGKKTYIAKKGLVIDFNREL